MTEETAQTEETERRGSYTCKGRARKRTPITASVALTVAPSVRFDPGPRLDESDDGGKSLLSIFRRPFDTFDRARRSDSGLKLEVDEEFRIAQRMARRSR